MLEEKRQLVTDDDDLALQTERDSYLIKKIFRFAVLGVSLVVLVFLTVFLIIVICTDQSARDYTVRAILEGLPGIVVATLAILGFRNVTKDR